MIDSIETNADTVYKKLASSGRYVNTGKVLIGVAYTQRPRQMTYGEERIQSALLNRHRPLVSAYTWPYVALAAVLLGSFIVACSKL